MDSTDCSKLLHGGMARSLSGISRVGQDNLIWMGIGFMEAIFCLGLICLVYLCYKHCECRRVPNKISAPDLPAGETRSESEDGGTSSSRLASFFQNQHHNAPHADATSEISQSDVWSFSLKSFTGMDRDTHAAQGGAVYVAEDDDDNQSYMDDSIYDASLYTSNGPMRVAPRALELPLRTVRRVGGTPQTAEV